MFSVKIANGGEGVWNLRVRVAPSVAHPLLVDTSKLGCVYVGSGSILVDPFGQNLASNLVTLRAEIECRAHVRSAQAAYVIS